jgi:transcriptional regulator with XRE-family HTH domain
MTPRRRRGEDADGGSETADLDAARSVTAIVGARLRQLRLMRGNTLQEIGSQAGISHSFLSMLERGQVDVSVSRLKSIADVYGIRLGELLLDGDEVEDQPRVVAREQMLRVDRGKGTSYRLLPHASSGGFDFVHAELKPRSRFTDVLAHKGFDCCWVVRGVLTLLYGSESYRVPAGNAVIYKGRKPHTFRNDDEEVVEFVALTTVPYW